MNKFKVGDWVVRTEYCEPDFVKGAAYLVNKVESHNIWVDGVDSMWLEDYFALAENVKVAKPSARNKYDREVSPGVWVDVYDVLNAWKVTDPCLQHLIKKALAVGQRGHKDTATDYKDILDSAQRAVDIYKQWENK